MPLSPPARQGPGRRTPDPEPPPALTLGLSKAGVWAMVPSVHPGAAPSAEDPWSRWVDGRSAFPGACSDRGPPSSSYNRARLHPPTPAPGPAPAPPPPPCRRPALANRPARRLSWNSCRAVGTYPSHLRAAARPQSLARDAGLEAPVGSGCSRLAGLCLPPGPSGTVTLLPGRLQGARPELEAGNRCASQTSWGSHSTGRDIRSSQNHTT